MIYLDNAATTQLAPEVFDAMIPYLTEQYANAGSIHSFGMRSAKAIKKARKQVADLLCCEPEKIIFTSGGSEGNNLVIKGLKEKLLQEGKTHIITSATEHHSVLHALGSLTKDGFDITYVKPYPSHGFIDGHQIKEALRPETGLVSIMARNNETGAVNNICEIAEILEGTEVLFHSDQVQAGYRRADLGMDVIDFATISAHKFHGPKGIGAVYAKDTSLLQPLINGGSTQEFGIRGGTENTPAIVGMGVACELFRVASEEPSNYHNLVDLKYTFWGELSKNLGGIEHYSGLPGNGVHLNYHSSLAEGISSLRIEDVLGETLVLMMDSKGVCISAGSACSSNSDKPSHALLTSGLTEGEARRSVRVSFSKYTTREEVVTAAEIMAECIEHLRRCTT